MGSLQRQLKTMHVLTNRRRRERLLVLIGATAAAAGAAYFIYKHVTAASPADDASNSDARREEKRQDRAQRDDAAAEQPAPQAEQSSSTGARKNAQLAKIDKTEEQVANPAPPALVGKKGTRWWYAGTKGMDRKAGIAAQQREQEQVEIQKLAFSPKFLQMCYFAYY